MRKIILVSMLVLGLIMVLMPAQAFAKIDYTTAMMGDRANTKSMHNVIRYGIYDYKKFSNIQKAVHSKNTYYFLISDVSAKSKNNTYCAVATIFVLNEHNSIWHAAESICDTGEILIHVVGSIKKGLLDINKIAIRKILTGTNEEYKIWR